MSDDWIQLDVDMGDADNSLNAAVTTIYQNNIQRTYEQSGFYHAIGFMAMPSGPLNGPDVIHDLSGAADEWGWVTDFHPIPIPVHRAQAGSAYRYRPITVSWKMQSGSGETLTVRWYLLDHRPDYAGGADMDPATGAIGATAYAEESKTGVGYVRKIEAATPAEIQLVTLGGGTYRVEVPRVWLALAAKTDGAGGNIFVTSLSISEGY